MFLLVYEVDQRGNILERSSRSHPHGFGQGEWVFGCCFPWVETMLGSELDVCKMVSFGTNCMIGGCFEFCGMCLGWE